MPKVRPEKDRVETHSPECRQKRETIGYLVKEYIPNRTPLRRALLQTITPLLIEAVKRQCGCHPKKGKLEDTHLHELESLLKWFIDLPRGRGDADHRLNCLVLAYNDAAGAAKGFLKVTHCGRKASARLRAIDAYELNKLHKMSWANVDRKLQTNDIRRTVTDLKKVLKAHDIQLPT